MIYKKTELVLVSGASGFVGTALCQYLLSKKIHVVGLVRKEDERSIFLRKKGVIVYVLRDWNLDSLNSILKGVNCVVHCAARAHILSKKEKNADSIYEKVNVYNTKLLATAASKSNVTKFIFISSIKALGERSFGGLGLNEISEYMPEDAYGRSKAKAEQFLLGLNVTDMRIFILRIPLVYGSNMRGNLRRLAGVVRLGLPIPLFKDNCMRSLLGIENLIEFLFILIQKKIIPNKILHLSDGEDVSIKQLVQYMASSYGKTPRFIYFPFRFRYIVKFLPPLRGYVDKVYGNLQLDCDATFAAMNWYPRHKIQDGIIKSISNDEREN